MVEVLAELPPALAVAEPFGAELAEAWPVGPEAVALLPEPPAPALVAVLEEFALLAAAPSAPVT